MKTLTIIITQVSTLTAIYLMWLGHQWMVVGFGLHPFIALPLGTLFALTPYVFARARPRNASAL